MNGPSSPPYHHQHHHRAHTKQRTRAKNAGTNGEGWNSFDTHRPTRGGGEGGGRTTEDSSGDELSSGVPRNLRRRDLRGNCKTDPGSQQHSSSPGHHLADNNSVIPQSAHKLNSLKVLGPNGGLKVPMNGSPRRGFVASVAGGGGVGVGNVVATESHVTSSSVNHRKGHSCLDSVEEGMGRGCVSDEDSHSLRSRKVAGLRVRPYAVNHKPSHKSS